MGIFIRIRNKAFRILSGCEILYKTNWYKSLFLDPEHSTYPDNYWYREHDERNFDLINLGSSGAKWAFDYDGLDIKAMNWAQAPQTLLEDYNLLRHFHSILRDGGYVLITIMPFTGLNKATGIYDALKYVNFNLQGEPIEPHLFQEASRVAKYPILLGKVAAKEAVKYLLHRGQELPLHPERDMEYNTMSDKELQRDALMWIEGWKKQFQISDLEAPLTEENRKGRKYRIDLMREIIDFCRNRGYKPVYVIPPVTSHLSKYYSPRFEHTYVYSFLQEVARDIPLLDYSKDNNLTDSGLYFNSFFMNKKGRKTFTKRVLSDIGLIARNNANTVTPRCR